MKLTARERAIMIVFILVCCSYGAYTLVYRPLDLERQRLENDIRLARKKFNEQNKVISKDRQLPQQLRQRIENMRQKGNNEEVMSGLIAEIESAARGMNIRIIEIKPQGTVKDEEYNRFTVSLTLDGRFHELMAFVHLLQGPGLDLNVTQLNLEKMTSAPGVLLARIAVRRTLIRPLDETAAR